MAFTVPKPLQHLWYKEQLNRETNAFQLVAFIGICTDWHYADQDVEFTNAKLAALIVNAGFRREFGFICEFQRKTHSEQYIKVIICASCCVEVGVENRLVLI